MSNYRELAALLHSDPILDVKAGSYHYTKEIRRVTRDNDSGADVFEVWVKTSLEKWPPSNPYDFVLSKPNFLRDNSLEVMGSKGYETSHYYKNLLILRNQRKLTHEPVKSDEQELPPCAPPQNAEFLLRFLIHRDRYDDVLASMEDRFEADLQRFSPRKARLLFWYEVVRELRPSLRYLLGKLAKVLKVSGNSGD